MFDIRETNASTGSPYALTRSGPFRRVKQALWASAQCFLQHRKRWNSRRKKQTKIKSQSVIEKQPGIAFCSQRSLPKNISSSSKAVSSRLLDQFGLDPKSAFLSQLGLYSKSALQATTMHVPQQTRSARKRSLRSIRRNGLYKPSAKKPATCDSVPHSLEPPVIQSSDTDVEAEPKNKSLDVSKENFCHRQLNCSAGIECCRSFRCKPKYFDPNTKTSTNLSTFKCSAGARCRNSSGTQRGHSSGSPVLPAIESVFSIKRCSSKSDESEVIDLCSDSEDDETELHYVSTLSHDSDDVTGAKFTPGVCGSVGTSPTWTRNVWDPVMTTVVKPSCRASIFQTVCIRDRFEPQKYFLLKNYNRQSSLFAPTHAVM